MTAGTATLAPDFAQALMRRALVVLAVAALSLTALAAPARAVLNLQLVEGGFDNPVFLTHAGDARLFVVEQDGLIKVIDGGSVSTFIDLTGKTNQNGERGLLGLAFHPNHASNGLFYVFYVRPADGHLVLAEYSRATGDPNAGDLSSERIVMIVPHPSGATNHNGGTIMFKGEFLYWTTGDGGSTPNAAQDKNNLLGKVLRIDPLDPDGAGGADYTIPSSNPFVGTAGRDEVWAFGLRNPYRCSFDRQTGDLWCGDVGQNNWEEVDHYGTAKGRNFGWPLLEGNRYYNYPNRTQGKLCSSKCKTRPIAVYGHNVSGADNGSITGGYVARRAGRPLTAKYVFGDFISGRVWAINAGHRRGDPLPAPLADTSHNISSFGEDAAGQLYLVDYAGSVYRLTDS